MVEVRVLVGRVGGRGLLEMEGPALAVIGQVQRRESRAEGVRAAVEAGHAAAQVEVVHCGGRRGETPPSDIQPRLRPLNFCGSFSHCTTITFF